MKNSDELIKKVRQELGDNRYVYWQRIWYQKIMEIFPGLMDKVPYEVYREIDEANTKGLKYCELPYDIFLSVFEKIELNGQLKKQIGELFSKSKGNLDYELWGPERSIHFDYKGNTFRIYLLNAGIKNEPTTLSVKTSLTPKQVAKNLRAQGFKCKYQPWKRLLGYSETQAYKIEW